MKRMIAIKMTLAMFFFFFASLISSQSTKIPENFVEAEIPIVESSDWFKLSHSLDYFAVKKVNNELVIEKTDFKEKIEFSTKNAKLVGYD